MPASEAPITGKVRKKSSSGHTTIGRRSGVQGATTEINHFGELGTQATTFGQGDLQPSDGAAAGGETPRRKPRKHGKASKSPAAADRSPTLPM